MLDGPPYQRVRGAIADAIANGKYSPGSKLPSEARLAMEFGVNRLTVRRAIDELARAGALESRQGSGTFVIEPMARVSLAHRMPIGSQPSSITEQIAERGYSCEYSLIRVGTINGSSTNTSLELPRGPLWFVSDALVVDGAPWMWATSWFSRDLLSDPARDWDKRAGLCVQLNEVLGYARPVWQKISADSATPDDAEILSIRSGAPLLISDELTADGTGVPAVRRCLRVRMDRIDYQLRYDVD